MRLVWMSAAMLFAAAACATASGESQQAPTEVTLAGVGDLPAGVQPTDPATTTTSTLVPTTTSSAVAPDAFSAVGNRLLIIGDSILASTARRYTDDMCEALVPLGWRVELDAESNRFIGFGNEVLSKRLGAGWDAAVIMLGNNYDGDAQAYRRELERIVARLSPRPVVLLTITEFRDDRREVNDVIRLVAATREHVYVADWAARTDEGGNLLGFDGLHLTDRGRQEIAALVADTVGTAPERPGRCLGSEYTDDSAGPVDGGDDTTDTTTGGTQPKTTVPKTTVPKTTQPPTTPPSTDPPPTDPPSTPPPST